MSHWQKSSLEDYLHELAARKPVPGGGSAAALMGATGVALITMAARYALGKGRPRTVENKLKKIVKESERIRKRLLKLVDLDVRAYSRLVKLRQVDAPRKGKIWREAQKVPREVCQLSYAAVRLTPLLVHQGSPYLICDVEVALDALGAAFNAALRTLKSNL